MTQRRAVALIRVSKAKGREDLISPELQRRAVADYAENHHATVTQWVEVLDESASQNKSRWWTTLDRVVEQVEAGTFDTVLVWKFSRAARHRRRWAVALDKIELAGATLESATEGLDVRTATGRLARGMLAELNAWESEVKGEQWKEVHAHRLSRGLPANGKPRFGYLRDSEGFAPDPATAPAVIEAFHKLIAGTSATRVAAMLNNDGVLTTAGGLWTASSLVRTLDAGFSAGLIRANGSLLPGAHEPLITEAMWKAYLRRRAINAVTPPRLKAPTYEFTGILRCSQCGYAVSPNKPEVWQCAMYRSGRCRPRVAADLPIVRKQVREWIADLAQDRNGEFRQRQQRAPKDQSKWERQVAQSETRLISLARKNLDGLYDDATYLSLRDEITRKRDEALKNLDQPQAPPPQVFQTVLDGWDALLPLERRESMMLVIRRIEVQRHPDPEQRYRIIPLFSV